MPKRMKIHKTTGQSVDKSKLEGVFFANEFPLSNPGAAYIGVNFALQNDQSCTKVGPGFYEFPVLTYPQQDQSGQADPVTVSPQPNPVVAHFKRLLQFYEDKEELEICRIFVQQTGIGVKGTSVHDYGQIGDDLLRIIINLRPNIPRGTETPVYVPDTSTVGVRLNIATTSTWLITRRSYGTVLAGPLSNISISSGVFIPGTRNENGNSLYVVMDIKPLHATRANVADRLCAQNPLKAGTLIEGLKKSLGKEAVTDESGESGDSVIATLMARLKDSINNDGGEEAQPDNLTKSNPAQQGETMAAAG